MEQFEYYAFISYKREDEKWAKWLQDKLRWYKLPSKLCKQITRLPKRVWPVFRDNTSLDGGVLELNIRQELEKSQYLIVICSPEAAQSKWVGKEVEFFAREGHADKIIPFVVSGIPYSGNPETECVHDIIKAVCEKELLAININEDGIGSKAMKKRRAFIRVVARLLDIKFDLLWRPYERAQKIQKWIIGIAAMILLAGITYTWDYNRTKCLYYADFVEYGDEWQHKGVVPLDKKTVKHRNFHYRFEYKQNKLRTIVQANSAGVPINLTNGERSSIYKFNHPTSNNIMPSISLFEANGKEIMNLAFGGLNYEIIDVKSFDNSQSMAMPLSMWNQFNLPNLNSGIKRYVLFRNKQGYVIRKEFKKYNGENIKGCDANGVYGFNYELDSVGRIVSSFCLGFDLAQSCRKDGVAVLKYEYDRYGNRCKMECYDINGLPTYSVEGWHMIISKSDDNGNPEIGSYYGIDNKPCYVDGKTSWHLGFDNYGRVEKESSIANGQPCYNTKGYSTAIYKYNKNGKVVETSFYDVNGNPCLTEGIACVKRKYDNNNNVVEESYYDVNGEPCIMYGVACLKRIYDHGKMIEESGYDINGVLCATWKIKYDQKGNKKEQSLFGANGHLLLSRWGAARVKYKYDDNMIEWSCFGEDNNPCLSNEGYYKRQCKYDERGLLVEETDYDVYGEKMTNREGYSFARCLYDDMGNLIMISFFDKDGNKCQTRKGADIRMKYDKKGNRIEESSYGIDGKLYSVDGFITTAKYIYDEKNNKIEESFFGIDGDRTINNAGYSIGKCRYDNRCNPIEISFFGIDGKPCCTQRGFSRLENEYDKKGNLLKTTYWGVDGCLANTKIGYSKIEMKYDEHNEVINEIIFDKNNRVINNRTVLIGEIQEGGSAYLMGLKGICIILHFGDYQYGGFVDGIQDLMIQSVPVEKVMVVMNNEAEIRMMKFPKGEIGMSITPFSISDSMYNKVLEIYKNWKENKQYD